MEEQAEPLVRQEAVHELGEKTSKKKDIVYQRRKQKGSKKKEGQPVLLDQPGLIDEQAEESHASVSGVSPFDHSVENHFRAMDKISVLCGEEADLVEEAEMKRLSEMVTFLSEWRCFNYEPRTIRFASETGVSQWIDKDVLSEISLSQFSSATVPKAEGLTDEANSTQSRNDFVFYAGGSIWALDWCPRPDMKPNTLVNSEFVAVSAHPPDSAYHKLGAPLSGRGMVQIWCLLNDTVKEEGLSSVIKPCTKPQKKIVVKKDVTQPKRPRGRPRKHPVKTTPALLDSEQHFDVLAIEYPESGSNNASVAKEDDAQPKRRRGQHRNQVIETASSDLHCQSQSVEVLTIEYPGCSSKVDENLLNISSSKAQSTTSSQKRKMKAKARSLNDNEHLNHPSGIQCTDKGSSSTSLKENSGKSKEVLGSAVGNEGSGSSPIPKDILPPRVVLCLGHNGKVAWDVKWRPTSTFYSECKHRLGYLAVLLGDGSLEVWEIPSPRILKAIYLCRKEDRIDPRFVELKPVFRCSKLRCGDRQSIPLTVEWSTSPPHDLILAGCHDGMVALWKFSASSSPKDSRPILCFSADTVPIRTLAWAPSEGSEGDAEGGNIIVTAGHEGMKFWDLRDPFRPLWDISAQRFIYSLDWHPDPRCILTSYDDGTLRILSLSKAAYDVPATGKPFTGTPQQGLHTYSCSPFSIWSIQVSRHTGMVAYCGSNGTVLNFQLTSKAVDKDPHRNRTPHFLCGSLIDEDGILIVNTPLTNCPYPMKRSINEWGNTPRSLRGFIYDSNRKRRAKEQKLDNQPLALCYGEDAVDEDLDQPISTLNDAKSKKSKAKKAKEDRASIVKLDVNLETESEIEAMPSKLVAMHKVRWNVNKGSRRWLCYGGASGIVRCQEIIPPEFGGRGFK